MASRTADATELRIPADPQYIVVAQRAAAGLASAAVLGLEALDELNIAIAEACEHTIRAAVAAGMVDAKVRINFQVQEDALRVEVRLLGTKPPPPLEAGPRVAQLPPASIVIYSGVSLLSTRRRATRRCGRSWSTSTPPWCTLWPAALPAAGSPWKIWSRSATWG